MRQLKISAGITARDSQTVSAYLREIDRYPLLSPEEEGELARLARRGDRAALARIVNCNLRFVVSVAKQYPAPGMPLMDVISEGNMGLIKAAERFDETRGFKFISYAVWWVRQSIMQAIADQGRMVRVPMNKLGEQHRIYQYIAEFEQREQHTPSPQQIADGMGLDVERVTALLGVPARHASIDSPIQQGEETTLGELLPDRGAPGADRGAELEGLRRELERAIGALPQREADVVRRSYGIGQPARDLDEIALSLGLTRERVRQIREKAVRRIRHGRAARLLQEYL